MQGISHQQCGRQYSGSHAFKSHKSAFLTLLKSQPDFRAGAVI